MGEKNSDDISSESTHQIHSKKACIILGRVSTKVVQRIVNLKVWIFDKYFSFSLTWDHMEVKVSNDISSERTHYPPKFMDTPGEGLCQNCSKNSGSQWGIIKCAISWKPLVVDRNGPKFGRQE